MEGNVIDTLKARGLLEAITGDELRERVGKEPLTIYSGFDCTADSLHVGHLLPALNLRRFQLAGHTPIVVVGGGTSLIGDPSGKRAERKLLDRATIDGFAESIRKQLAGLLDFSGANAARMRNNADWLCQFSFIDMLRDVGKFFRLSDMLEKDSVRSRLESEAGISFTEFTYMILQSYDFLHLYKAEGCQVQGGGSDQWGNITAGTDLIRKSCGGQAYGVTYPLLLNSKGEKFGKSEGNAVWLDPNLTSPYDFYQFWIRTEDADVERLLKYFTFIGLDEIAALAAEHRKAPEKRLAQQRLAHEMTTMLHGEEEAKKSAASARALYGGSVEVAPGAKLADLVPDAPRASMDRKRIGTLTLLDLVVESGLAASKGEARRLIQQGGAYLNQQRIDDGFALLAEDALSADHMVLLRAGKKNYVLVEFS
ncbi:MAG: tyrosine--tRNA ligase [Candidatus Sumerlaeia bacterium]|nr:tyrosine--tRNA ligase [Candidatus Sumerlaeia bacterium]